jgi:hypothetical protein
MKKVTNKEIEDVKEKIKELEKVLGKPIHSDLDKIKAMHEIQLRNIERVLNELAKRQIAKGEIMKINKIELEDYKLFKGKQIFEFIDGLNLISGACGSGKTIIFKAMKESIAGEVPSVKISLEGELDGFKKNLDLIFIDEEELSKIADEASSKTKNISSGQQYFSAFITIMKRRVGVKKNLPLVMDTHLFAILDHTKREALVRMIRALKTQVIIFEHDFKGIKGNKEHHLNLQT